MWLSLLASALADPSFDAEPGLHEAAFSLAIRAEDGGELLYSLDGSEPTLPYSGPIRIERTSVVRAVERATDGTRSPTLTRTFVFVDDVLASAVMDPGIVNDPVYGPAAAASLRALPILSLVVPGGLSLSEQAASLEWIDPDGDGVQANCGARIIGGTSQAYAKTSFRVSFRSAYGPGRLHADLYGEDATGLRPATEFDQFTLRSGNHDSVFYLGGRGQYLRNLWMDETQLEMGHIAPHGRFAHLYVNGAYNGLYHLRERFDAASLSVYLGGEEEDYEAINGGSAFDGSGAAWSALLAATSFAEARRWLDVANFLDYMILNFYAANAWDWSYNHNWIAAGPVRPDEGGFRFHSADSDICLYYDPQTDITSNPGPSNLFATLLSRNDPDFQVALMDAIHRNLEDDGPLTPARASERYARLAALIEDAVVAESARWGAGWWDREGEWRVERDWLVDRFLLERTEAVLAQVRARGWYPLPAPTLSIPSGIVEADTALQVTIPEGTDAELWVSLDGDPRLSGGAVAPTAELGAPYALTLDRSAIVQARLRSGDTWGPLARAFYEVDEAPALLLNEWNAVEADRSPAQADPALGARPGNGGDWLELLVLEDLDLRGWRLVMEDRGGPQGTLTFTEDPLLATLRAGTLITIAEDLPEDPAYDPASGDWRFHLRAGASGSGRYVSAEPFDVSARDWQLTILDAEGRVRFGPAGEGVSPRAGISGDEVGRFAGQPGRGTRRDDPDFGAGAGSTYGAPNAWADGAQDLRALRGEVGGVFEPLDSGVWTPEGPAEATGCATGRAPVGLGLALLGLALTRRRAALCLTLAACRPAAEPADSPPTCYVDADRDGFGDAQRPTRGCGEGTVAEPGDCDDASDRVYPGAPELCDGLDGDCDGLIDDADPDLADGLPWYRDADGDGYGGEELVRACAAGDGLALQGGDCDEADPTVHPNAPELCDELDQDCDGLASDAAGASPECAAERCEEEGLRWIALPSGDTVQLWCDPDGWMLGFLRNSVGYGSHAGFGGSLESPEDLAISPAEASSAGLAHQGWLDLNALDWTELALGAYANGAETYRSRPIPRSALRIAFGENGYLLYGEEGYWWCGGEAAYTDAGVGAVNNPAGAPADCRGHGSLGSGWDFSETTGANAGLTLCGADGSSFLAATWGGSWTYYGNPGGAQAIWVR